MGEAETYMAKVERGADDLPVARKVEGDCYELFRPFSVMNQAAHRQFSNRNSQLTLDPNTHTMLTPTRTRKDAVNAQTKRLYTSRFSEH